MGLAELKEVSLHKSPAAAMHACALVCRSIMPWTMHGCDFWPVKLSLTSSFMSSVTSCEDSLCRNHTGKSK